MDGPAGSGRRVDVILDGPNDYITKTMNTFDAPALPIPVQVSCKVKGDRHCATVSCAAVIAKVTRDHLMVDIAQGNPRYAPYGWAHNGYDVQVAKYVAAQLGMARLNLARPGYLTRCFVSGAGAVVPQFFVRRSPGRESEQRSGESVTCA